jgi:hypothetical protein
MMMMMMVMTIISNRVTTPLFSPPHLVLKMKPSSLVVSSELETAYHKPPTNFSTKETSFMRIHQLSLPVTVKVRERCSNSPLFFLPKTKSFRRNKLLLMKKSLNSSLFLQLLLHPIFTLAFIIIIIIIFIDNHSLESYSHNINY